MDSRTHLSIIHSRQACQFSVQATMFGEDAHCQISTEHAVLI